MHNNYNLNSPLKQTKHMPKPIIANYALILLRVMQDANNNVLGGYNKRELVGKALGHIDSKYSDWGNDFDWSQSAFCTEFATFNTNQLLIWVKQKKRWYPTLRLIEYVKHHFGKNSEIHLLSKNVFDEAVAYNEQAQKEWDEKRAAYRASKK